MGKGSVAQLLLCQFLAKILSFCKVTSGRQINLDLKASLLFKQVTLGKYPNLLVRSLVLRISISYMGRNKMLLGWETKRFAYDFFNNAMQDLAVSL
jgi:hypothetical protein